MCRQECFNLRECDVLARPWIIRFVLGEEEAMMMMVVVVVVLLLVVVEE